MSHIRVLICRVDDPTSEPKTELAAFDLPTLMSLCSRRRPPSMIWNTPRTPPPPPSSGVAPDPDHEHPDRKSDRCGEY